MDGGLGFLENRMDNFDKYSFLAENRNSLNLRDIGLFSFYKEVAMRIRLFLFIVPLFLQGSDTSLPSFQDARQDETLRTIVFVRTEGLLLIQLLQQHTKDKKLLGLCKRIIHYYKETQSDLLKACKGKDLQLSKQQFEYIQKDLQTQLLTNGMLNDSICMVYFREHISKSIQMYSLILKEGKGDDISYFSFRALPQLLNINEELNKN